MMRVIALAALVLLQSGAPERHRNLGKAYYERGEYARAVEELTVVLDADDARARDYFNAGMAYLQNGQQDEALAAFTTARQMDPALVEVDFGLGVLYKRQLRYPLALDAFQRVAAEDPDDPATWFNIGAVSASMSRAGEAEQAFAKVVAMGYPRGQNFYVSALFRQANIVARRGEQSAARELLEEFRTLRDEIPNVSLTATALENGVYGRVEIPVTRAREPAAAPPDMELDELEELRWTSAPCGEEPSLALGDYDGDADTDIFIVSPCGDGHLFDNGGGGVLTDVTAGVGLSSSGPGMGAVFVDLDGSGLPSLFVWESTESRLFRNRGGRFEDATAAAGLAAGATMAVPVDADNDGRVDLFVSHSGGGSVLHRNLDDGRFDEVWRDDTVRARGGAAADFDDNGFPDIVVAPDSGNGILLANEGGAFEQEAVNLSLSGRSRADVHVVDLDHDGDFDIVASDEAGASSLLNREGRLVSFPALHGWASLVPLDLDRDGYTSLLGRDARDRYALVSYRGGERFETRPIVFVEDSSSRLVSIDAHVVAASEDGLARVYRRGGDDASPAWLRIALRGTRTNRQGLGAVVEVKAGRFYQKLVYPGHPVTTFLGHRDEVDVVRVTWANGVIQNEVDVATRRLLAIEEAEQQTSSCPFLYVWDGERFRFLTDVVGRAPLGEILPGGGGVVPNPDDYVRIPPGALVAGDGRFELRLTEELRELAAIDAVELVAVDHASGVDVYANERFSSPPFEPFRLYAVRDPRPPVAAVDGRGRDVLDDVRDADGRYAPITRRRPPGFAEEHALVLTAPAGSGRLWLFLTGWVYWPSSSSMRALDYPGAMKPRAPMLQVKDQNDRWVTVVEDLGLPSGLGRTLVTDLTGVLPSGHREVRIVSNFAVYWDRALFGRPAASNAPPTHALAPLASDLHYRGFSAVTLASRDVPERYDYEHLQPEAPWNAVSGDYTRFGDVSLLVDRADGASVVMAPGDEMSLSFDATRLPPLTQGSQRTFFVHLTGWAKDQDPNTLSSTTVSPLPGEPVASFQSREVPSLVIPLAPP